MSVKPIRLPYEVLTLLAWSASCVVLLSVTLILLMPTMCLSAALKLTCCCIESYVTGRSKEQGTSQAPPPRRARRKALLRERRCQSKVFRYRARRLRQIYAACGPWRLWALKTPAGRSLCRLMDMLFMLSQAVLYLSFFLVLVTVGRILCASIIYAACAHLLGALLIAPAIQVYMPWYVPHCNLFLRATVVLIVWFMHWHWQDTASTIECVCGSVTSAQLTKGSGYEVGATTSAGFALTVVSPCASDAMSPMILW